MKTVDMCVTLEVPVSVSVRTVISLFLSGSADALTMQQAGRPGNRGSIVGLSKTLPTAVTGAVSRGGVLELNLLTTVFYRQLRMRGP
jgi:hypothetical protein